MKDKNPDEIIKKVEEKIRKMYAMHDLTEIVDSGALEDIVKLTIDQFPKH